MASGLPMADPGPATERTDAARNRAKILAAAEELFARHGIEQVSVDDVARRACVGKGTIYRRFGDRAGLAHALLDQHERAFQEDLIRGDPPLGPGAPPLERLIAFGEGYVERLERHAPLLLAAEMGLGRRYLSPAYRAHHVHVSMLLAELDPGLDAPVVATMLLDSLSAQGFVHATEGLGVSPERVAEGWRRLVRGLASAAAGR